jgi:hypothetical protein
VSGAGGGGGGYSGGKAGRKRAQGDPWISAPRLCPQSISPFRAHPTPVGVKCHVVPVPLSSFLLPLLRSVPWPVLKAIEPTLPLLLDSLLATAYVVQIHKLKRRALQIGAKAPVFSSLAV